jgi:hypothetical protein
MFLDRWGLTNVITLDGTDDASSEASAYQTKLEAIPEDVLPRDADGFPIFDLALIGVGDDGHSELYKMFGTHDYIVASIILLLTHSLAFLAFKLGRSTPIETKSTKRRNGPLESR